MRIACGNGFASIIVGISTAGVEKRYIYTMSATEKQSSAALISVTMNDYATGDATVYVNGNLVSLGSNGNAAVFRAGHMLGARGDGLLPMSGLFHLTVDGVEYSSFNNWNGATWGGTQPVKVSLPIYDTVDAMGLSEQLPPALIGYNFTGQNLHYYDTTTVLDHTPASSFGVWVELINKGREQLVFSDDVVDCRINTSGNVVVTFNGTTLTSTTALDANTLTYIGFSTDGSGNGSIYLGDELTEMTLDNSGSVGVATSAAANLILGSDSGLATNGLVAQFNHYPLDLSLAEHESNRAFTKKKSSVTNNQLPYNLPFNL